ncbi:tyrosine-protein phosphatase [Shewanella maritima]|uniref:phosphatase domain-containing putative toxin n=1 Tax=Shewanella maritima TaxID=2520507 RepID=UPI001A915625|nr:tyrosine-protein phosphatase [Shewanella maritima]
MITHPYDALKLDNGAQLIFTPCPGTKGSSIDDSVATLKQAGADVLLTLMFDKEMAENNASDLAAVCYANEMNWLQLPIADDAAPGQEFETAWEQHKDAIVSVLNKQGSVAVHCKGGSGRTGLVIGIILRALGLPRDEVVKQVQALRPKALKHPVQLAYFLKY